MKKNIPFLLLCLVVCACLPTKSYVIIPISEIEDVDFHKSNVNYIPLSELELQNSAFLNIASRPISEQNYDKFRQSIELEIASGNHASDIYLAKALLLITKKDYIGANQVINLVGNEYPMVKALLLIDLHVEVQRMLYPGRPVNLFFKDYQKLADAYPDNKTLHGIIFVRLRCLQYSI